MIQDLVVDKDKISVELKGLCLDFEKIWGVRPVCICIDDEPMILEILKSFLSDFGLEVQTFGDPLQAQVFAAKEGWRTVLSISDYTMPKMNGFEFRRLTQELLPRSLFVVLSGYVTKDMAMKAMELKIDRFLDKPYDEFELLRLLYSNLPQRINSLKDDEELLKGFIDEAKSLIEQTEALFLELEEAPANHHLVNQAFGMIHTMKGNSGFFEPRTLHTYIHRFEDLLRKAQNHEVSITSELVSLFLSSLDQMRELLSEFESHNHKKYNVDELTAQFQKYATAEKSAQITAAAVTAPRDDVVAIQEKKKSDIRVDVEILDELMGSSGEMTVVRNMINKSVRTIEKRYSYDKDVLMLGEMLEELHKMNSNLQSKITEVRKVPVRFITKSLVRLIRDLCKNLNKECELKLVGEDLRVDTSVADVLQNSFIHLIRNSLDHGLESREERLRFGKSANGQIEIRFYQKDDFIFVEIQDDGRGINTEAVRKKALTNGLMTDEKIRSLTEEQIQLLIFEAGFSTAQAVTEISGRGVGMSMVKDKVEAAGGQINVRSSKGMGATFILKIPVPKSVLIKNCLFVSSEQYEFGIPQENICRITNYTEQNSQKNIHFLEGGQALHEQDELIPLLSLSQILDLKEKESSFEGRMIVIVEDSEKTKYGIIVSRVLDFEDAVVKELARVLKNLKRFSGTTFLSNGMPGLLLDIDQIGKAFQLSSGKRIENKIKEIAQHESFKEWILIRDCHNQNYALDKNKVFRIEEFEKNQIRKSTDGLVAIYRDKVLHFITELKDFSGKQKTLILLKGDRYYGMAVDEIIDIIQTKEDYQRSNKKKDGCLGYLIVKDKPLSVLDVDQIISVKFGLAYAA